MQSAQGPEPPTSATRQVWAVPELVGMILSHLDPRDIMVCKRIDRFTRDVINGNADTDVGRKIWIRPSRTRRKLWLFEDTMWTSTLGQIAYVNDKGRVADICKSRWGLSAGQNPKKIFEPVVANPLLVQTWNDRAMEHSRKDHTRQAILEQEELSDLVVVHGWLARIRPCDGESKSVHAWPRSRSILQDPLWLQGKGSTSGIQLFDPPIHGKLRSVAGHGKVSIYVIPQDGSNAAITWGAIGRTYNQAIDRYTNRQKKTCGNTYIHMESDSPLPLTIRAEGCLFVPQDLYWWLRQLLEGDRYFDLDSDTPNGRDDPFGRGAEVLSHEIARHGYRVPPVVHEELGGHATQTVGGN